MTSEQKINDLQNAMHKTKKRREFERYQAVLLFIKGFRKKDIADIIGRCAHTVHHYVLAYEQGGSEGLKMGVSTGNTLSIDTRTITNFVRSSLLQNHS